MYGRVTELWFQEVWFVLKLDASQYVEQGPVSRRRILAGYGNTTNILGRGLKPTGN